MKPIRARIAQVLHSTAYKLGAGADDTTVSIRPQVEQFFSRNNIKWELLKDGKNEIYAFTFQGGQFLCSTFYDNAALEICFPGLLEMPLDEIELARTICNQFNNATSNYKFIYSPDEQNNIIRLHTEFILNAFNDNYFAYLLENAFRLKHELIDYYRQQRDARPDPEIQVLNNTRELALLRELELRQSPDRRIYRTTQGQAMQLGHAIENLFALDTLIYKKLTITRSGGDTSTITDGKRIHRFDLAHAVLDGHGSQATEAADYATLVLDYYTTDNNEVNRLVAFVANAGHDNNTFYFRINLTLLPPTASPKDPIPSLHTRSVTLMAAYDKNADEQKRQEFDYMYTEAKRKQQAGEQLSEHEMFMLSTIKPDVAYCAYWGYKLLLSEHYLNALEYLLPLYDAMQPADEQYSDEQTKQFHEICYFIGLCYTHLHSYEKAYFYLDTLARTGNIRYAKIYIATLLEARDFRVFETIDAINGGVNENFNDIDEMPEHVVDFVKFLRCRHAQALIEFDKYPQAERELQRLLRDPDCADFAKQQLARIAKADNAPET